jgi:hypothetical protein
MLQLLPPVLLLSRMGHNYVKIYLQIRPITHYLMKWWRQYQCWFHTTTNVLLLHIKIFSDSLMILPCIETKEESSILIKRFLLLFSCRTFLIICNCYLQKSLYVIKHPILYILKVIILRYFRINLNRLSYYSLLAMHVPKTLLCNKVQLTRNNLKLLII